MVVNTFQEKILFLFGIIQYEKWYFCLFTCKHLLIFSHQLLVLVLVTCCIIFHFESWLCKYSICLKMNKNFIAGCDNGWWYWITIFSNHRRCNWTTIIYGQCIQAETIYIVDPLHYCFMMEKSKSILPKRIQMKMEKTHFQ